jgi:hypothetical protein
MCQMFLSTDEHLTTLEVKGEQIIDPATRDSASVIKSERGSPNNALSHQLS